MAQGCLKCLKYTMCVANFFCFLAGVAVLGFGIYMTTTFKAVGMVDTAPVFSIANMLLISGIIITCVSFLGFLGALKENRCLLLTFFLLLFLLMLVQLTAACLLLVFDSKIADEVDKLLTTYLEEAKKPNGTMTDAMKFWDVVQEKFNCCGVRNVSDWGNQVPPSCCRELCISPKPPYREKGCLDNLKTWFEDNFLAVGISVIILCIIEVLGMCFSMTLFCHISRSGLGYKL